VVLALALALVRFTPGSADTTAQALAYNEINLANRGRVYGTSDTIYGPFGSRGELSAYSIADGQVSPISDDSLFWNLVVVDDTVLFLGPDGIAKVHGGERTLLVEAPIPSFRVRDGKVYFLSIVNEALPAIKEISLDGTSQRTVFTYDGPLRPTGDFTLGDDRMYLLLGDHSILVINIESGEAADLSSYVDQIEDLGMIRDLCCQNGALYFLGQVLHSEFDRPSYLYRLDLTDGTVTQFTDSNTTKYTLDEDNIYFSSHMTIYQMDRDTLEVSLLQEGLSPTDIQMTRDHLLVNLGREYNFYYHIIEKTSYDPDQIDFSALEAGSWGNNVNNLMQGGSIAQRGNTLYYSLGDLLPGLRCVNLDGSQAEKTIYEGPAAKINVIDGTIYFLDGLPGQIRKIDLETGRSEVIAHRNCRNLFVNQAYMLYQVGSYICVSDLSGQHERVIATTPLDFLPYNGKVVFRSQDTGKDGLFQVDLDGSNLLCLSEEVPVSLCVDGDALYYSIPNIRYLEGTAGGRVYRLDGDGTQTLLRSDCECRELNVAGDFIIFRDQSGQGSLYRMDKNGEDLACLVAGNCENIHTFDDSIYFHVTACEDLAEGYYTISPDGGNLTRVDTPSGK